MEGATIGLTMVILGRLGKGKKNWDVKEEITCYGGGMCARLGRACYRPMFWPKKWTESGPRVNSALDRERK